MTLQTGVELALAVGAAGLLTRDVGRTWRDRLRRPVSLLVAGLMAALLVGINGGRAHPEGRWRRLVTRRSHACAVLMSSETVAVRSSTTVADMPCFQEHLKLVSP